MTQTEELVSEEFSDAPVMIAIARCESHFREYDAYGHILKGKENQSDEGIFQINVFYHPDAKGQIETPEGNIAYARKLYEEEGTTPWNWSKPCWSQYQGKESMAPVVAENQ